MALPGVRTVLKDAFGTLSRTDIPVGPRVLAIGRRDTSDGTGGVSDYDPYEAKSEDAVKTVFGENSELHRAYYELVAGGAARVLLVALPKGTSDANIASTSAVTITGDGTDHNHGSHIVLDVAFDAAEVARPDFIVPWGRGGHPTDWEVPSTPNETAFGFYANNSSVYSSSLAARVADKCMEISERSHPVMAVMGIRPYVTEFDATPANAVSTSNITASQLASHFSVANLVARDDASLLTGMYVSVIATEMRPIGYRDEWGYSNGAAHYAATLSQMVSYTAPTGKPIINVSSIRYNPTRVMQDSLIAKGVVPVTLDYERRATWVDAQTFAVDTSDFVRLTTMRIVFDVVTMVRQISQQFIGEASTLENRNSLETAISSGLRQMTIAGALLASDFVVEYKARENSADVHVVLTPAFELRTINIDVSIQL